LKNRKSKVEQAPDFEGKKKKKENLPGDLAEPRRRRPQPQTIICKRIFENELERESCGVAVKRSRRLNPAPCDDEKEIPAPTRRQAVENGPKGWSQKNEKKRSRQLEENCYAICKKTCLNLERKIIFLVQENQVQAFSKHA